MAEPDLAWSAAGAADLAVIYEDARQCTTPLQALARVHRLVARCGRLGEHWGKPRPDLGPGVHMLVFQDVAIIYACAPPAVRVLALVAGALDLRALGEGR